MFPPAHTPYTHHTHILGTPSALTTKSMPAAAYSQIPLHGLPPALHLSGLGRTTARVGGGGSGSRERISIYINDWFMLMYSRDHSEAVILQLKKKKQTEMKTRKSLMF